MTFRSLFACTLLSASLLGQESVPSSQPTTSAPTPPPHSLRTLKDMELPQVGAGRWRFCGVTPPTADPDTEADERVFLAYHPKGYEPGNPCVLLLHGGGGSALKLAQQQGGNRHWTELADRDGFLLVLPQGTKRRRFGDRHQWNDVRPVGSTTDDVGFLDAVLDVAIQVHGADPDRIYVTGSSNGGMMTFRMVMERSERFAAAAAFIASLPEEQTLVRKPIQPIPLLMCNGTADSLIQWGGGEIRGRNGMMLPVMDTASWWAATNGCKTEPEITQLQDTNPGDGTTIERLVYPAEEGGVPFELLKVNGGGHGMPSIQHLRPRRPLVDRVIGTLSRDLEGAAYAWDWMKRFARRTGEQDTPASQPQDR